VFSCECISDIHEARSALEAKVKRLEAEKAQLPTGDDSEFINLYPVFENSLYPPPEARCQTPQPQGRDEFTNVSLAYLKSEMILRTPQNSSKIAKPPREPGRPN